MKFSQPLGLYFHHKEQARVSDCVCCRVEEVSLLVKQYCRLNTIADKQLYICWCDWHTVFLQSDATAALFSLLIFLRLLFKGGIYFFRKPTVIRDGWIGYVCC